MQPDLKLTPVKIYTDGACTGNPGPGGYGVIIIQNGEKKELSGGVSPDHQQSYGVDGCD